MIYEMIVFCGRSNPPLGEAICKHLRLEPGARTIENFSDGEIFVQIKDNVRGMDAFIIQSTCPPGNENLMELLIMIDAMKRSSAARITAVIPYFGYARQDRTDRPRVAISAKLVADMLTTAGADRVLTVDLHAGQVQGFFAVPVDNLYGSPVLMRELRGMDLPNPCVVSPDAGGVERARYFAKRMDCGLAIIDKRRDKEVKNKAEAMNVIGTVKDCTAIIVDDMVDTAGTLVAAAGALKAAGARRVIAVTSHPVCSGPAFGRLAETDVDTFLCTNTIHHEFPEALKGKVKVVDISMFLADAIARIHFEKSLSELYYDYQ